MFCRSFVVVACATKFLFAQDPTPAPTPNAAAPTAPVPALPAAGSAEALALVDQAIAKMSAYARGTWKTSEEQDSAMMRGAGLPFGNDDVEVQGGWLRDLVWGEFDDQQYVRANGRLVAKVDGGWRLRGSKLGRGRSVPFTLDPELLFVVLAELPVESRQVVNVDRGEVANKPVTILSLELTENVAAEFVDCGVVPAPGSIGAFMVLGAARGIDLPQPDRTVQLALFVDDSGDLLRFACKVFEKNPMFGNVQVQVAGAAIGGDEEAEGEEVVEAAEPAKGEMGPQLWKKGFPQRKPAKDESVATFRADFQQLGRAEAPALDQKAKQLLRVR
jgi:hypothetical protein